MNDSYFGVYRSTARVQNCIKQVASAAQEDMNFPAQINYLCDLCKEIHMFTYSTLFQASTPRQQRKLYEYFTSMGIETDITLG